MVGIFSEYCGPDLGIWKGTGLPRDKIDKLCKKHDMEYDNYLLEGYDPYTCWNLADENFLAAVKKIWYENPPVAAGAITWFQFKKAWSKWTGRIEEGMSFYIFQCNQ